MTTENTTEQARGMAAAASATVAAGQTMTAPGTVWINHPETGERLTYTQGEALPAWVAEAFADRGRVSYDAKTRVWTIADAKKPARS